MPKELILTIDQGTTGTTCLLVDAKLQVVAQSTHDFHQHFPAPDRVEHDPEEIWASVMSGLGDLQRNHSSLLAQVIAIGITNQRETCLIWDRRTGEPIHRALVWQDRRTAKICEELKIHHDESAFTRETGLLFDPYFSATKLAWMLDHENGARKKAEQGELLAGTMDTYLLWRLTGGVSHATEPSNASRTALWPLQGEKFSAELCELFRVPQTILPRVQDCNSLFGVTKSVPGLSDGIPIHGIAGDQQAALFGQACFNEGEGKCTYGTGAFILVNTGSRVVRSRHRLLTSVAWRMGGRTTYCLEGSTFMAGAVMQWLRDGLGVIERAEDVETLATSVDSSEEVVLVPAHAGLGAPHWNPHARGLICGLTRGTTKAHLARAALEGVALQIDDLIAAITSDLGAPLSRLHVDGGAAANNFLMQLQADLLDVPLHRPMNVESTALGAACFAGLGVGLWTDQAELSKLWCEDRKFIPQLDRLDLSPLRVKWKAAVSRA